MIDIDNVVNLKIGDILVKSKYNYGQIELYIVLGVKKKDVSKIISKLKRNSQLNYIKSNVELVNTVKSEMSIQVYSLGVFLSNKNDFLVDRSATLNYIKLILKNVLSRPLEEKMLEDPIKISLLTSTYHKYNLFQDIELNKDTVKAWLNKSMLLNKVASFIEIEESLNLICNNILKDCGEQIDILSEFDKYTERGLVKGDITSNFDVGDIIYKYTPKMIKYYLYLGEKDNTKYIIKIDQIKKEELRTHFKYNSIVLRLKYCFRNNMKEELQSSKQDYYKTGVNVLVKFQKEIQEELDCK